MKVRSDKLLTFMWSQVYNPLQNILLSALVAALPIIVLLGAIGIFRFKAHFAALLGLAASLAIAVFEFGMPVQMSVQNRLNNSRLSLAVTPT